MCGSRDPVKHAASAAPCWVSAEDREASASRIKDEHTLGLGQVG